QEAMIMETLMPRIYLLRDTIMKQYKGKLDLPQSAYKEIARAHLLLRDDEKTGKDVSSECDTIPLYQTVRSNHETVVQTLRKEGAMPTCGNPSCSSIGN